MRLLTVAFDRGFARDRRKHEVACLPPPGVVDAALRALSGNRR